MAQQNNGQLGDWATKCANAKPIEVSKKVACLELFKQGMGFRKAGRGGSSQVTNHGRHEMAGNSLALPKPWI